MALDEPKDNDEILDDNGVTYLIEKKLLEDAKPISVDFVESAMGAGFSIASSLKKEGGCGSDCC